MDENSDKNVEFWKCYHESDNQDNRNVNFGREEEETEALMCDELLRIPIDEIETGLYLSCYEAAIDHRNIDEHNIKRILTLNSDPIRDQIKDEIIYKYLKIQDYRSEDILSHLLDCIQFIKDGHMKNENVLVHCTAGISRSATVVIAFIMNKHKMSYSDAYNLVKSKSNAIKPNKGFEKQLLMFEKMNFTIDPNNKELRLHLFSWIIILIKPKLIEPFNYRRFRTYKEFLEALDDYFKRLELIESYGTVDKGRKYLCQKCDNELFNEIDVIRNDNNQNENNAVVNECENIYIAPKRWMNKFVDSRKPNSFLNPFGPIICFECKTFIGEFNTLPFVRFTCKCPLHSIYCPNPYDPEDNAEYNCLLFRIEANKYKLEES